MTKVYRSEISSFVRKFFIAFRSFLTSNLPQPTETKSDIFSVDVAQMKFNQIFFTSDDFITAFDVNRDSICCASYSGRIVLYDFVKRTQVVENRLKLQKRKSSTSDTDTFEIPHVSTIAFSLDGCHLLIGLENGSLVVLDPSVLHEVKTMHVSNGRIVAIKFSPDSSFVTLYVREIAEVFRFQLFFCRSQDENSTVILMHHEKPTVVDEGWKILGRVRFHAKAICDVLYISPSSQVPLHVKVAPRLISLAQDRVSL